MTDDQHISLEWYYLVAQGRLPPSTLADRLLRHLQDRCPECCRAWEALGEQQVELRRLMSRALEGDWQVRSTLAVGEDPASAPVPRPLTAPEPGAGSSRYTSAFGRAARRLDEEAAALRQRRIKARHDLKALLRVPPDQRRRRIERANSRFRTRAFAELLLEESRSRVRSSPAEAAGLAALVPTALLWIPGAEGSTWAEALRIRALAHHANALRVAGDLAGADRRFAALRRELVDGPADAALALDLDSLEASLRLDQRRFEAAGRLLDRAVGRCRRAELGAELGRLLVQRSELRRQQDRLEEALSDARAALDILDPRRQNILYLCALGTVTLILCDSGRFEEAAVVLERSGRWWRDTSEDWWSLRLHMVAGRVAFGCGSLETAAQHFELVLQRCRQVNCDFDAAMAALDLALVNLAMRCAEVAYRLAEEALETFRRLEVTREGLAAIALLDQAVRTRRLDILLLGRVRSTLAAARQPSEPRCLSS